MNRVPRFELARVTDAGVEEVRIMRLSDVPVSTRLGRRGFIGSSLSASAALGAMASGCGRAKTPLDARSVQALQAGCEGPAHDKFVSALAFVGRDMIASSSGGGLKLWSFPQPALVRTLDVAGWPDTLSASRDGRLLAVESADGLLQLWSTRDGTLLRTFAGAGPAVKASAFSSDGKLIAWGNTKGVLALSAVHDGALIKAFQSKLEKIEVVAVSADGNTISAGHGGTIETWDVRQNRLLRTIKVGGSAKLSGDGSFVASETKSAKGLGDCVEVTSLVNGRTFQTARGDVEDFALNDSHLAVLGSHYDTGEDALDLWSLADGELVNSRRLFHRSGHWLALSADAKHLIGADEGYIKIWSVDKVEPVQCLLDLKASPSTVRGLTYTARNEYGVEVTYTLPCGSPIPADAVCTCNCVPGSLPAPEPSRTGSYPRSTPPTGGGTCTCNLVCTCMAVPICQAHKLLDADRNVRAMAEQLVFLFDPAERDYFEWAIAGSRGALRRRIAGIAKDISKGRSRDPSRAPCPGTAAAYLVHRDAVVRIMAAQILTLLHGASAEAREAQAELQALLHLAVRRYWRRQLPSTRRQTKPS